MIKASQAHIISANNKPVDILKQPEVYDALESIERVIKKRSAKGENSIRNIQKSADVAILVEAELVEAGYRVTRNNTLLEIEW